MKRIVTLAMLLAWPVDAFTAEHLSPQVTVHSGAVNQVVIERAGSRLAVYASPDHVESVEYLLLTHHRRDVISGAKAAADSGTKVVAPQSEQELIASPQAFWSNFVTSRFHDYGQQSTKILAEPPSVSRWVSEGEVVDWQGLTLRVLDTAGYTRGSVSYVVEVDGQKLAFTGDLIYGDGQILDLYSFQDAIPEADVRGYHGYGSRLAALVASLEKVAAETPHRIVPARGPVIHNPEAAIQRLITRVRALYSNYLSTNALHWYFKEERMRKCGARVLGEEAPIELMPYALYEKTPDWVFEQATSRLLISEDGHGFLLDCGYERVVDAVKKLMEMGLLKQVDGIFVTHYHDDHTDMVQAAATEFQCPVYATAEYEDVLERPQAYHLPAMTSNPILDVKAMRRGERMKWREFQLEFHFYPGQTFFHGGLLVQKHNEPPIFFIGDSFAPSGIDDYCVQNRNLLHEDSGYLLCLKTLQELPRPWWIVNEHIPHVFTFSPDELTYLETRYRQRIATLRELFPWDDPNYGIDEQWAVFYPYGTEATPGQRVELEVRLTNHSPAPRRFQVTPHAASGVTFSESKGRLTLPPRGEGKLRVSLQAPTKPGTYIVTADIRSEGMEFLEWAEALISVK